ncbi:MAG: XisH family protein [Arcicella sp.]|nr:XisH family protein [Arcicella sp.]
MDLTIGEVELLADLGAERVIGAERNNEKIAVEIKSFEGQSPVSEFHKAIGQYENYRLSLEELEPERRVWLAIPEQVWQKFFQRPFIKKAVQRFEIEIIVFNPETSLITAWIN